MKHYIILSGGKPIEPEVKFLFWQQAVSYAYKKHIQDWEVILVNDTERN